jgi:hypothetical protein
VATWAGGTPYTDYTTMRTALAIEEGESQDATAIFLEKLQFMRSEYEIAREIARDLFQIAEHFIAYGFHLPYPGRQEDQFSRVNQVITVNAARVSALVTPVLPAILITRLQNALTAAQSADDARDDETIEAKIARQDFVVKWDEDSKNLRTLYRWCVMIWGDDDVKLNALGFVRASQQGQNTGTTSARTRHESWSCSMAFCHGRRWTMPQAIAWLLLPMQTKQIGRKYIRAAIPKCLCRNP